MKVETQTLENHHAKMIVEVEPDQIEKAKQRAARQLANRVKIPGFRPGKAPYHIIERTLGLDTILQQAYEIVGEEIYPKALDETGLKPYAPAKFQPPSEQTPNTFEFTFPMDAAVELGDYRAIRIPYELPATNEEDIEKTLADLRDRNAVIEPVDRPSQVSDEITVKLSGKRTQPAEGEDPVLISERSQTVLIKEEDDPNEWPYPGFAKALVGLSAGEEKTTSYTFPKDTAYTSLSEKEIEYHVVVEQVKSRTLPELNDEFAKSVGDFETLQALKDTIREGLVSQIKMSYDGEYNEKVLNQVIAGAKIQYPPEMVDDQITSSIDRLKNQLAEQGQEFDTYLKVRSMDLAKLREQYKPQSENAIARSVVLYEIAQIEGITVDRQEMENEALTTMNNLMHYIPPDRFKRMSKDKNFISQLSRNASVDVLTRKTFERLNAIARGEAETIQAAAETPAEQAAENEAAPETQPEPVMETPVEEATTTDEELTAPEESISESTQQEG